MKDKSDGKIIEIVANDRGPNDDDYDEDDDYYSDLRRLYEGARVTALDVNKKLDDVAALLDRFWFVLGVLCPAHPKNGVM